MVAAVQSAFRTDWEHLALVEVDDVLCRDAGDIGAVTGARSLDAMHLAALQRAGPQGITLVTADLRQAQAGRSLGFEVLGS
jgi:predicted nucleic acid-binding protein